MPDPSLLDPSIKVVLDQTAAAGGPLLTDLAPPDAREVYRLLAAMAGAPDALASVSDREIAGVPCRVYVPESAAPPAGVLAWFHGGGWVIGDLETADPTAAQLAARSGCVVVSVDYRLAPEHPYPAAVDDCWAVLTWLAGGGALELGAAPGAPLAVGGDSAGGNLAAVVAVLARDAGIELAHQLLVYPVTDLSAERPSYGENAEGYLLTADAMRWFIAHYTSAGQRAEWQASPLLAPDLAGVAPAHVVTAGFDPLRDEGDEYASRLSSAGVPVVHDRIDSAIHGFFAMGAVAPVGDETVSRAAEVLARAINGGSGRLTGP